MKKIFIFSIVFVISITLGLQSVYAQSATIRNNVKSSRYSSSDNIADYTHSASYVSGKWETSGNSRTKVESDLYFRDYYKVSYIGILGSPQNAFPKESIIQSGERAIIEKLSFFTSEELIHTKAITLALNVEVNDIKGGFGSTWSRVTRYGQGIKITTDVGKNNNLAPLVAMPVYKVEARVREVLHTATSTRGWALGKWSDEIWSKNINYKWITLGYVGYYTYLGDNNDTDYQTGNYLINNHPQFSSNLYKTY